MTKTLQLYNTFSQKKENFEPIEPKKVRLYVCGPTVYDLCHVGHARVYLFFDVVVRFLRDQGYEVTYVRNLTDIDDKIIKRSAENQETCDQLTTRIIQEVRKDFDELGIVVPTVEPCATQYIPQMIAMIERLIEKGYAYVGSNQDVYYQIERFEEYGALSHRNLDDLKEGARVEIDPAKRNPLDFVLWKSAKPGEPAWESPWGMGRPGWHIECSAMSLENLGETLDIHGGGPDLIFPHHENERAQSEAASGKPFVRYWMHVGYVRQNKQKMSKSDGNFLTIRDFLKSYHSEVLRFFAIGSHYRSPIDYSLEQIDSAGKALERLYVALRGLDLNSVQAPIDTEYEKQFYASMEDDFNTPEAIAVLFSLSHEINRLKSTKPTEAAELGALLKKLAGLLGLLELEAEAFLQNLRGKEINEQDIEALIEKRNAAREAKDWAEADKIREILSEQGIVLEDSQGKTTWHALKLRN